MDFNSPICRVCLNNAMELIDLETAMEETSPLTVLESFNACTQLNAVVDDELPKYLCISCNDNLRLAYDFVRKAQDADILLRVKLKEGVYELVHDDEQYEQNESEMKLNEDDVSVEMIYQDFDEDFGDERHETMKIERLSEDEVVEENPHNMDGSEHAELPFECSQCKKLFRTADDLEAHLKKSHKKKKLLCNICGKTCATRSSLSSHILQHKGEKPFTCKQCDKKYFTKNGLHLHMSVHEGDKPSKFLCSICGKGFATKQRLDVHHFVHTDERNYNCSYCEKKFATPFRLRNHIRIHTGERPFECITCGLKFAQANALKCHERIHTGERPYECKICGKRFNQNTILKTHMTLHTGKTVKCPSCDKKFSRPSCLILHQREHTGEKPYACFKCPNRYKQKSHLDRHLDTHFGIKHQCSVCGKEYSKRSSLKIHMFDHSEEKPFHCGDCSATFTRRDKYKAHLKKMHGKIFGNNAEIIKVKEETALNYNEELIIELQSDYTAEDDIEKGAAYQIIEIP